MLTVGLILIGIAILVGIWYNGKHQSDVEHEVEARGAEVKQDSNLLAAQEAAAAAADAARKESDEREAAKATAPAAAVDFLRDSFSRH